MDAVQEIRDAFSASERHLNALEEYLKPVFSSFCESHGYSMKHRVKSLPSVAAKLQQGRYETWSDLDDLVAFTVVVPTRSHEDVVETWLGQVFEHARTLDRSTAQKPPDTFRFDSTRWYGRLRDSAVLTPEHETFRRFLFEVQVKTVFEDAWGIVTHDLVYKGDDPTWNRARLASQLKAAIEQIDVLVDHFESSAAQLPSSPHVQTDKLSWAISTLAQLIEDGIIDTELRPTSWTSLVNNLWSFASQQPTSDGDGFRSPTRVFSRIVKEFDTTVRSGSFEPLLSATMFDAVVASAVTSGLASVDDFFLVDSEILVETFGLIATKAIDLGPAFSESTE